MTFEQRNFPSIFNRIGFFLTSAAPRALSNTLKMD